MPLTARLLAAASKLRELAPDGVVEAPSAVLARALGASTRTLRTVLGELAQAQVLSFSSGRGPGALVLVTFPEKRKEKRKEAEKAEGEAEEAETGRGRGGVAQTLSAPKESAAASGQATATEKRKKRKEKRKVAEVVLRLHPEDRALIVALLTRVSPGEAPCSESSRAAPRGSPLLHRDAKPANEPSQTPSPPPATTTPASQPGGSPASASEAPTEPATSRPAQSSSPTAKASSAEPADGEPTPTAEQVKDALEFRVEQQRSKGFKSGEAKFRKFMRRALDKNPREVFELLDEKRELVEATGRDLKPEKPAHAPPPALVTEGPGDVRAALAALAASEEKRKARFAQWRAR